MANDDRKQLWFDYFEDEKEFLNKVRERCIEQCAFGVDAYPQYQLLSNGHYQKPRFIRWLGHCNGNMALLDELRSISESLHQRYLELSEDTKRSHRAAFFYPTLRKLRVNKNPAFSSKSPIKNSDLMIDQEWMRDNEAPLRLIESKNTLESLGIRTEIVKTLLIHKLVVDYSDVCKYFELGEHEVIYRIPSGTQYRARLYTSEELSSESFTMKLGFFISLNEVDLHYAPYDREERYDSYEKRGTRLPFPVPTTGQFWHRIL